MPSYSSDENLTLLQKLLREMFQLDKGYLDFGLYRIMNMKSAEVEEFISNDLLPQVEEAVGVLQQAQIEKAEQEFIKERDNAKRMGIEDPEQVKLVREKKEALKQARQSTAQPTEIYKHLHNFFGRYYDKGDFISLRRYKASGKEAYLIPYNGEEVKLHWANADQYYIKTAANYQSYIFTIGSADCVRRVRFHVVDANVERDNIKEADDKKRRFVLSKKDAVTHDEDGTLLIAFEHRPLTAAEAKKYVGNGEVQQRQLNEAARDKILKQASKLDDTYQYLFSELAPTDKNLARTVLDKHLETYVAKNEFDYFIHKDLEGFLRRELDFYLKNEVLFLEDIERDEGALARAVTMMKAVRLVAHHIIAFLTQIEEFQKQLWLKKKFVLETNYCITLNRVPSAFYDDILANEQQIKEWNQLFAIDELLQGKKPDGAFLASNPFLVLDTRHFSQDFKDQLLASLSDEAADHGGLEKSMDGVLIHGENFQALNLLQARYREQVQCIYIDPPYNAKSSEILYKNNYKTSSFLAFLIGRIDISEKLMTNDALINVAIDDYEHRGTIMLMDNIFSKDNFIANVIIQHNPRGRNDDKFYGTSHEYMIVYAKNEKLASLGNFDFSEKEKAAYNKKDLISNYHEVSYMRTGNNSDRHTRPKLFYPIYVNVQSQSFLLHDAPNHKMVLPINSNGEEKTWRWGKETFLERCATELSAKEDNEGIKIYKKRRLIEFGKKPKTVWHDSKYDASSHGIMYLRNIMGKINEFSYPKSIHTVEDCLQISSNESGHILDYFAGSGTTGHAVINLNRADGGRRQYILVEVGHHFDDVLVPRLKKVTYATTWKDGKPQSRDGSSQFFKYMRLESHEDALDSLVVNKPDGDLFSALRQRNLFTDYQLRYALTYETRASATLLGKEFSNPDQYTLNVVRDGSAHKAHADLAETFNYLLGIEISGRWRIDGVLAITGVNRKGTKHLILWRDMDDMPNTKLESWFKKYGGKFGDVSIIYVNGDQTLNAIKTGTDTWEAQSIEPTFRNLMFEATER